MDPAAIAAFAQSSRTTLNDAVERFARSRGGVQQTLQVHSGLDGAVGSPTFGPSALASKLLENEALQRPNMCASVALLGPWVEMYLRRTSGSPAPLSLN